MRRPDWALRQSTFVCALQHSDELYRKAIFDGMAGCLCISHADIEDFIAFVQTQ
jgi:hypothetical protein